MKKPLPQNVIKRLIDELAALPQHPRVQIIVTHCYLELLVHQLALQRCKNSKRIAEGAREFTQSIKVTMLNEAGIISDEDAKFLHWFRRKRNDAAHEVDFKITKEDLSEFRGYTASDRKTRLDDPKHLSLLCAETVMGFWNHHVQVFAPLFEKRLFEKQNG
ncbi:MAG: hypothetical protein SFU85_04500 [Candidatus Methylacidiphilales bacterium]|nr:hypothetical protein [Candidatus Methylacidiphilales bacterium]